ncbi:MAG: hypothetical protein M3P84_10085 [Chloroflexota bacterium]|nr:hypothetical protein [Chloroflexota bacterium]
MAGQTRSRSSRTRARSPRTERSHPVRAVASAAIASGPAIAVANDVSTRSTYRLLLMRGLAPDEAANLTAFLSGLHVGDQHWNLKELNQLLFLRDMQRTGRFGETDGIGESA